MFSVNICINKVVVRIIIEYSPLQEVRRFRRKIYKNNDNNDDSGHFPCNKTTTMAAHSRTSLLKNAVYLAEENSFLFYILAGNNSFSVQNSIGKRKRPDIVATIDL